MLSVRSFLLKSLLLITMTALLTGCCQLGFSCYELVIYGEPDLKNADIYIDNKLVKSSVNFDVSLRLSYEKHEIKVIQKGYKPFVAILEPPTAEETRENGFEVKLEPLDSVPPTPSSQSDTAK